MLYKAKNEAIEIYDNYSLMMFEAKNKATKGTGLKILTPKQMLQRLPIALAQVKAGINPRNLLNKIWQIVCPLYQSKQITKKVYNNIIKSIQLKIDTIFMNSENSKTLKPHVLVLKDIIN